MSEGVEMVYRDIKKLAKENPNFRKVIKTGKYSQFVLMSISAGGEIGNEVHKATDQTLFILEGQGEAVLSNKEKIKISEDSVIFVDAGTWHNIVNTGNNDLKLVTVYAPPSHKDGAIHATKEEADREEEY